MNAISPLRPRLDSVGVGGPAAAEVLASWRVQAGAVMMLGRARGTVPASGAAQIQRMPGTRGVFRCFSWTAGESGGPTPFLAAVRLPDRAEAPNGAVLELRGIGQDGFTLPWRDAMAEDGAFGGAVARLAGANGAAVARFVLDTLRRPAGTGNAADMPHIGAMLQSLLSGAAEPDGCIEIMAAVPDTCVLLQGWGARLNGTVQVVLAGAAVTCFAGQAGEFTRSDVATPATGTMVLLPADAAGALAGLEQVFVLDEHGLHGRTPVAHRLLDPASSLGHLRHMLPDLRGPAAMLALLQEAIRPRYEGRDTLFGHAHPVRAAVDLAGAAPGVGAYLSGWVFDPRRVVAALHLCGVAGPVARLDTAWSRVPRPDVSDAFRDEPGFPAPPDPDAGFAVFVPGTAGLDGALHLQFTFADGDRAFLPIRAEDPASAAFRARLLASVDLFKPSGLPIVERHVAPLLARVRPAAGAAVRVLLAGPVERADAVVVPLAAPCLPRAFLSGFLHDPLGPTEQLILVCGPEWDRAGLDGLRELVRFYALPATVLLSEQTACPSGAVRDAARATAATAFLVSAPGACGREAGWRDGLRRAAEAMPNAAFVCPTLLYEDWSIRFAGATVLRFQDTAPFTQAHAALAGMPAFASQGEGVRAAESGSLDCCLLLQPALAALDGPGALATGSGQEIAFFLRMRAAGLLGAWAPGVQVYAPESTLVEGVGSRVGRLADGWMLREIGMALGDAA